MNNFQNVDPKLIRTLEDRLEQVHYELHVEQSLSKRESLQLELEEGELVRALENLYMDKTPEFRSSKRRGFSGKNAGKYIDPYEDNDND